MAKIVPSDRLRRELEEVLAGVGEHDDPVEAVARVGARLILQGKSWAPIPSIETW